jgi:beta-galactosidase beta subunit
MGGGRKNTAVLFENDPLCHQKHTKKTLYLDFYPATMEKGSFVIFYIQKLHQNGFTNYF